MDNTDLTNDIELSEGQISVRLTELLKSADDQTTQISAPCGDGCLQSAAMPSANVSEPVKSIQVEQSVRASQPVQSTQIEQVAKDGQTETGEADKTAKSAEQPEPLSDMQVMEHTESIWQYREIIDNGTEMHSESHEKRITLPNGEAFGARVRGKKHKHEGSNCDDFFEITSADDAVIAVVSDGAGSKPLSRIGSRVGCETAAAYLKEQLSLLFSENADIRKQLSSDMSGGEFMTACGKIAQLVQQSAREAVSAQNEKFSELLEDEKYENALGRKPMLSDLSSTFLAAVAIPLEIDGKRQVFLTCVQIGDGCICAVDTHKQSGDCLRLMGEADSGKFSGETDFISEKNTKPDVISSKTRISRGSFDTIMLMSDGVADDYFPSSPMMKRLYLDLTLNGILPFESIPENRYCGEDPAPIRFRSVSLSRQSVALQYAKQLLSDSSPDAINALWDKRNALYCHSLDAFRMNIGDTAEERLRVWLDNYNERGSFDDRSLVVIRFTE